jgi:hypothetical protein
MSSYPPVDEKEIPEIIDKVTRILLCKDSFWSFELARRLRNEFKHVLEKGVILPKNKYRLIRKKTKWTHEGNIFYFDLARRKARGPATISDEEARRLQKEANFQNMV